VFSKLLGKKASKSPLQKAFCHIPKSKYGALLGKQREVLNNLETSFGKISCYFKRSKILKSMWNSCAV
jgi:hypothetical protein